MRTLKTETKGTPKTEAKPAVAVAKPEVKPQTQAELMAELQAAITAKDFKQVAVASRKIDAMVKAEEKLAADAKLAELKAVEDYVKSGLMATAQALVDSGKVDKADGIWFSWDFGDIAPTLRLTKTATKVTGHKSSGGGTGKKFNISTEDMIAKHSDKMYKESGMSFTDAYASNTDKNFRYGIRQTLLKLEGLI